VQVMPHLLYLRPRENPLLQVSNFKFRFQPEAEVDWMRDDFDNLPASVQFSEPTASLLICSECDVSTTDTSPFDFLIRDYASTYPFSYEPLHQFNLSIYLTPPDKAVQLILNNWLKKKFNFRPPQTLSWLSELNQIFSRNLVYKRREEAGIQSARSTLFLGSGTCRDFAMLFIECARTLGLAARFVSGYHFDPGRYGGSGGDMHAWVEVFLPGAGWRGIDPTNGIFCDSGYVPVAHAVVAESVNPIQGSIFSAPPAVATLSTDVRVYQDEPAP
jgi:transglutaminase-like putative cysteine protease